VHAPDESADDDSESTEAEEPPHTHQAHWSTIKS